MKSFSVAFLNVRSLLPHFTDFKNVVLKGCYDIVGLSETWLGQGVPDDIIKINGYNLIRTDRKSRGGGVAIYIKSNLSYTISYFSSNSTLEELWIETNILKKKYIFGTLYRPPKGRLSDFLSILEKRLSEFQSLEIICGGDINLNLLNITDQHTNTFYDYIESLNMQQLIKEPTRIANNSSSLLDIILVSNGDFSVDSGIKDSEISDHFLTYCCVSETNKKQAETLKLRNFKNIDRDLLNDFLTMTPFENIIYLDTVNDKTVALNDFLLNIFDVLAPLVEIKIYNYKPPWITYTIKRMIRLKNKAYSKYMKNKTNDSWEFYKQIKNQTNIAVRQEKKHYLQYTIENNKSDSKVFWKKLNELSILSKNKSNNIPNNLNNPNEINKYFLSVNSIPSTDNELINFYNNNKKFGINATFSFYTVSESVVKDCLLNIKSTATGADQINLEMILLCLDRILPFITNIVNSCLLENDFPDVWKISRIFPLCKKPNIDSYNDLRPINILPVLSKVLEKIMNSQIRDYVDLYNILPQCQSGFREGFSCTTALLHVTDDIISSIDKGDAVVLVLIDFSKAFDRMDHGLLLSVLHYIGFQKSAIGLINSYLNGRKQYVETDGGVSSMSTQLYGIPQGSILGPLLFCIYTSNITNSIRHCQIHLYADDTQLYYSFNPNNAEVARNKINEDLSGLVEFSKKHNLLINASKSTYLIFGKNNFNLHQTIKIKADEDEIPNGKSCRNLGLVFDINLRFKPHINKCMQRAYANLKKLFPHRHLLTKNQKRLLTNSLVLSHFNYADSVYGPCLDKADKDRIQRVQKSCLRFIYGIRRSEPISYKLAETQWLSMSDRRKLHSATLFHSIVTYERPSYLSRKIRYRTDVHTLNLRYRGNISPPIHNTALFERGFSYQIYQLYNDIPEQLKILHLLKFKIKYKYLLLNGS